MSLYHETADILSAPANANGGGLKNRVFTKKSLKSPAAQVYALATETCKWSEVLKEVVEHSELLKHERKLTPVLSLLLTHDLLLAKGGVALPASHGLRAAVERHRARLTSELTRARLRRKAPSIDALRVQVELDADPERGTHPRWVRVNALKTDLEQQLVTTFRDYRMVYSVEAVTDPDLPRPRASRPLSSSTTTTTSQPPPPIPAFLLSRSPEPSKKRIYIDEHVPGLVAVSPDHDITKTEAYRQGLIILQDKASCFPAYLLYPHSQDGDVIDACAAPGNKTTHLAAILRSHAPKTPPKPSTVFAFERDPRRAKTLEKMVTAAGSRDVTRIAAGQDFLEVDPQAPLYRNVGALLLDPSCSGSGIVGRDAQPPKLCLPEAPPGPQKQSQKNQGKDSANEQGASSKKRKRGGGPDDDGAGAQKEEEDEEGRPVLLDDDGNPTILSSEQDLQKRLRALSAFQLSLLLHAMAFPAARKISYSTCSIHAEENEEVVLAALRSDVAKRRGWRVLPREKQVRGMNMWPVRGELWACNGDDEVAEACIRTYKGDGRGVMGFFVAAFERDGTADAPIAADGGSEVATGPIEEKESIPGADPNREEDRDRREGRGEDGGEALLTTEDGPYLRDEEGVMVRDVTGMPVLKATGTSVSLEQQVEAVLSDLKAEENESSGLDYGEEEGHTSDEADGDDEWAGLGD